MMRVSRDPHDKGHDPHAHKRRVWCKDIEVVNWIMADEFRRVVMTADGRVLNGGVLIERLTEDKPPPPPAMVETPVDSGFAGAGLVHVPDKPAPAPTSPPTPEVAPVEVVQAEVGPVEVVPAEVSTGFCQIDPPEPAVYLPISASNDEAAQE